MIKKSRLVVSIGAAVALGIGSIAFADGVGDNTPFVDGNVKPAKLDKKKWKPVALFTGVRTEVAGGVTGLQSNPTTEYISYGKNIKFDLNAGVLCTTLPPSGSTPEQARAACPKNSYLGQGVAVVEGPGIGVIDDLTVSVFYGPEAKGVQLHTYSPTLGQAAPVVAGIPGQVERGQQVRLGALRAARARDRRADDHQVQLDDHEVVGRGVRSLQGEQVPLAAPGHLQRRQHRDRRARAEVLA